MKLPTGHKKIEQQVAQLMMSATETIRLRGTVRWQLSRNLKEGVSHAKTWGESVSGTQHSKVKGARKLGVGDQ